VPVLGFEGRSSMKSFQGDDAPLIVFAVEILDTTQGDRILLMRTPDIQGDCLIGPETGGFVHSMRVETREVQLVFGPNDEECLRVINTLESAKVHVAPVQQIDHPGFVDKLIEHEHIADICRRNPHKCGDFGMDVEKRVKLHTSTGLEMPLSVRPGEKREAEFNDCGVEGIDGIFKFGQEAIVPVECPGPLNERKSELMINLP